MDAERTGSKVVDPGRFDPDTPKRGTSQHPDRRVPARVHRTILRERVVPLLATIVGLAAVLAVAIAGTAVLLIGYGYFEQGRDQAERDSWSRKIETAIRALPGVTDVSHRFEHYKGKHFNAELDVRLRDDATPAEAASVVSAMGAQQLPRRFQGDPTEVTIDRMADTYSAYWLFGRDVSTEANAADSWARLWAAGTEVHWSSRGGDASRITNAIDVRAGSESEPHRATAAMRRIIRDFPELASNQWTVSTVHERERGFTNHSERRPGSYPWPHDRLTPHQEPTPRFPSDDELDLWQWFLTDQPFPFFVRVSVYDPPFEGRALGVTVVPPVGTEFSAAQTTQLADLHLPYLAGSGAAVDYTIYTPNGPVHSYGPFFEVVVGGCQTPGYNVLPESQPYVRQYERC
ncbi:hypothetical protein ACIA5H_07985 [Nocardia sp. NPDC051900]|uniref:hypothetical protein n=1 Tax=Nocardia sp. NPDC051900 TaxID=3364326 RepID=UPI0037B148AA